MSHRRHQQVKHRHRSKLLELERSMAKSPELIKPLEGMPHILEKLDLLWGSHALAKYLRHILMDSRDGKRKGFTVAQASSLSKLIEHNQTFIERNGAQDPENIPKSLDPTWGTEKVSRASQC